MNKEEIVNSFKGKKIWIGCILIVWAAAVSFFVIMASDINPWSEVLPHIDSAIFLRCGVDILQGKIMYIDMWDHKGPILSWLQALGLMITPHSLNGVWMMEVLFCMANLLALYKVARLITESRLAAAIAATLSLHPFYYFIDGGNTVEGWALPFISLSLYFFARFLKTSKLVKYEITLSAVCMTIVFLMNGNLVSLWVCFVPIIFIVLLVQKRTEELKQCILYYCLGIGIVVICTFIPMLIMGNLGAFFETYFLYNSSYVSDATFWQYITAVLNAAYRDPWFGYVYFFLFIWLLHKKEMDWRWSSILYAVIALLLLSMSGRDYPHYKIQLIPCMVIPLATILNCVYGWCRRYREFVFIMVLAFLLWGRYGLENYYEDKIKWTLDAQSDNSQAGWEPDNYTIVNEWIGHRWSDEAIEKWVINENYSD